jgi:uncharacterized Tic20 family protein
MLEDKYIVLIICFIILGSFLVWLVLKSKTGYFEVDSKDLRNMSIKKQLREVRRMQN